MSELKLSGRLVHLLPVQSGVSAAGKDWQKRDFVIEVTEGQFTKKVAFTLFGEKTAQISGIGQNAEIEVSFNIESREHAGKWYSNVNAWKVTPLAPAQPAPAYSAPSPNFTPPVENDLPF